MRRAATTLRAHATPCPPRQRTQTAVYKEGTGELLKMSQTNHGTLEKEMQRKQPSEFRTHCWLAVAGSPRLWVCARGWGTRSSERPRLARARMS